MIEPHSRQVHCYSLSNFVFNGFESEATQTGWALQMTLDQQGVVKWDTLVARLDPQGNPHPDLQAKSPCGKRGDTAILMQDHMVQTPSSIKAR